MTTFDRYLFMRFAYVFAVFFAASMGLYAVIDAFTNLDDFQQATRDDGSLGLLVFLAQHYLYQSSFIFDLLGPTMTVISALAVLGLTLRNGELHPVLAAGIPTYRVARPLVLGVVLVSGMLVANRELIIPRIAIHLQGSHGDTADEAQRVEPMYDARGVFISGKELYLETRLISNAEFRLPAPALVDDFVTLQAAEARYIQESKQHPGGWALKGLSQPLSEIPLTEAGRRLLQPLSDEDAAFFVTDVTFDQLYNRSSSFKLLSTAELIRRIRRPTSRAVSSLGQQVHLHVRLTQPLLTMCGLYMVIPLIVRRERMNLVTNIASCMAWLGVVFGFSLAMQLAGDSGLVAPDLAAWSPIIMGSTLGAWLSGVVRT